MSDDQAGVLPSVLEILRDYLIELKFKPGDVRIGANEVVVRYKIDEWCFAAVYDASNYVWVWPFATNVPMQLNPARPDFFDKIKEAARIPDAGSDYGYAWHY